MNTPPLRQVILLALAAPLLAACTGTLPTTSVVVTQPPAATVPAATTSSTTVTVSAPTTTVTVTGPGTTATVTQTVRTTTTVGADDRASTDTSVFASPSGRIVCLMRGSYEKPEAEGNWVRCDYLDVDRAWTLPRPKGCQWSWGATLVLKDTAAAGCVSQGIQDAAIMYPMNQSYQQWWHPGDPTVQKYGSTLAALPYGAALQIGPARCEMETFGVTCTNWQTGHGIFVSQSDYGMF